MKLHQKLITLIVVLALALASFGILAGTPVAQSQTGVEVALVFAPVNSQMRSPSGLIQKLPPVFELNVSWNG